VELQASGAGISWRGKNIETAPYRWCGALAARAKPRRRAAAQRSGSGVARQRQQSVSAGIARVATSARAYISAHQTRKSGKTAAASAP